MAFAEKELLEFDPPSPIAENLGEHCAAKAQLGFELKIDLECELESTPRFEFECKFF